MKRALKCIIFTSNTDILIYPLILGLIFNNSLFLVHIFEPQGKLVYQVTGDFQAAFYFAVDSDTGAVTVQNDLRQDLATSYTVRSVSRH